MVWWDLCPRLPGSEEGSNEVRGCAGALPQRQQLRGQGAASEAAVLLRVGVAAGHDQQLHGGQARPQVGGAARQGCHAAQ